jgi:hypothetical protein
MKNTISLFVALMMIFVTGVGCSFLTNSSDQPATSNRPSSASGSNKSITDRAVDTAVGETKIGIQSCDDVVDILNAQINDPDENFVTKAIKKTALNQFRDSVKKSIEENGADKQAVESFCLEFKKNLQTGVGGTPNS